MLGLNRSKPNIFGWMFLFFPCVLREKWTQYKKVNKPIASQTMS